MTTPNHILPPNLADLLVQLIIAKGEGACRGILFNLWNEISIESNFKYHHEYMIELIGEF